MAEPAPPSDRDALAAELALGLLEGEERATALRLCLADPLFAAQVEAWDVRLAPLFDKVAEVAPPTRVWHAIAARIDGGEMDGIARRLRIWRGSALLSGAIAASLALFIVINRPVATTPATQIAVAQLVGANGGPILAATYNPKNGVLRLSSRSIGTASRAPELWVIPADGVPRSLGLIKAAKGGDVTVPTADRRWMTDGSTLAVTLEDPATAPHAAPSGAPILTGKISAI